MSVWTNVHGTIEIPLAAHYSLKKGIDGAGFIWETTKPVITEKHRSTTLVIYHVSFAFSDDGMDAARQIRFWLSTLPEGSCIDIVSEVRWLG